MTNKNISHNPYRLFDEKFKDFYSHIFKDIYINNPEKYSLFIENNFYSSYEEDPIYRKVFEFKNLLTSTNSLKKFQMGHINSMNDALALYLFWQYGKKEEKTIKVIGTIILLFRDFLNRFAWDLIDDCRRKKIDEEFFDYLDQKPEGEFTATIDKSHLHLIIDDFIFPYLTTSLRESEEFKPLLKSTIFELSKMLQEESLIDFIMKPLEF